MPGHPNRIDMLPEEIAEGRTPHAGVAPDKNKCPVEVYKNTKGEIVFKIVNLIEAVESTPEQIKSLVSVRNISAVEGSIRETSLGFMHNKLCIFCDNKVDIHRSTLFCQSCSKKESLDACDASLQYNFL